MYYAVGDIHGSYEDMQLMIDKINEKDPDAVIIFVGDFVDRGENVPAVLDWCMKNIHENGENRINENKYQSVRGNHEDMVIDWYYRDFLPWWKSSGYSEDNPPSGMDYLYMPRTHYDFAERALEMEIATPEKLLPYIRFFESLPYYKTLDLNGVRYRIVHAFYDVSHEENEDFQHQCNIWGRQEGNYKNEDIIVHGHTPTAIDEYIMSDRKNTKPGMIAYRRNDINVDGGCVFGGRFDSPYPLMLCAICLNTLEEIYPYSLEQRFDKNLEKMKRLFGEYDGRYRAFLKNRDKYLKDYIKYLKKYDSDEIVRMRKRLKTEA